MHSATTALGRQECKEGGGEDKWQDLKLLCSHIATGVWKKLRNRASNRSFGVREGSRAGVRNTLQRKEPEEVLERQQVFLLGKFSFHARLGQNFLQHIRIFPPQ